MHQQSTPRDPASTQSNLLASFALSLELDTIPAEVVVRAKRHFLDVLGIALASSRFEFGEAVLRGARELGDGTHASVIGTDVRLPAASAALVNGVLAHGLDFDDTHIGAIYHASAQAMAAALAAGQANNANPREVLLAFIVALEVGCRIAKVGAPGFHNAGFHPTALAGTFAAAAAAGRLYRLEQQQLVWALGLCGSQAAGILEIGNSWLKRLHPGWAAHSGLSAVALARAGFIGPDTVFEGHKGFYATHLGAAPEAAAMPAVGLGENWLISGIALKPYPCCHFIHAFVDAALELRGQFTLDEVERIECPLTPDLHPLVAEPRDVRIRPQNPYQALFSVPYVVALALSRGKVDLASFHDQPLDMPDVLAVADKIYCVNDPDSDFPRRFPGEVVVYLKDGRILNKRMATSLGTPERPLAQADIVAKFMANATRTVSAASAEKLALMVLDMEHQPSLESMLSLCQTVQ